MPENFIVENNLTTFVNNPENKDKLMFRVGEYRLDKRRPNPYTVVDMICNIICYDWNREVDYIATYYYDDMKEKPKLSILQKFIK